MTTPETHPLLPSGRAAIVIGVHNALAARIAQKAGFDAGWVSSLELSTALGVPDRNVLGIAEVSAVVRSITLATRLPLVIDMDNGYGSPDAAYRAARDLSFDGAVGLCMEDSLFPKANSFDQVRARQLQSEQAYCELLEAATSGRESEQCLMIARCESLIAGEGVAEALRRAKIYVEAGADLVLLHTKDASGTELRAAAAEWDLETPLVSVSTAFESMPTSELVSYGYSVVIYANQMLRSSVASLTQIAETIRAGGVSEDAPEMVSVAELLSLGDYQSHR